MTEFESANPIRKMTEFESIEYLQDTIDDLCYSIEGMESELARLKTKRAFYIQSKKQIEEACVDECVDAWVESGNWPKFTPEEIAQTNQTYDLLMLVEQTKGAESDAILLPRINRLPEHIVAIIAQYSPVVADVRYQGRLNYLKGLIATDNWLAQEDLQNYTGKQLFKIFRNTFYWQGKGHTEYHIKCSKLPAIKCISAYNQYLADGILNRNYVSHYKISTENAVKEDNWLDTVCMDRTKSLGRQWVFLQNIKAHRQMVVAGATKAQKASFNTGAICASAPAIPASAHLRSIL